MRVLAIGGSGEVGHIILPKLALQHWIRVFDLKPPPPEVADFHKGNVNNSAALRAAMEGVDVFCYMAAGRDRSHGRDHWDSDKAHMSSFDVNVRGVHLALRAAHQTGLSHAVYLSTMSVYQAWDNEKTHPGYFIDENLAPDAHHIYGFTKRLGEEVCLNATRLCDMSVNVLRLCLPMADAKWSEQWRRDRITMATAASDLVRAVEAAFTLRAGFQIFTISGDYTQQWMRLRKAKALLGWEPLARPT